MAQSIGDLQNSSETCYQFDQDMLYGGTKGHESGSLPSDSELSFMGTKNGLNASGEVCLVAFGRSKVKQVTTLVDIATGMVQTMMCQAKKANPAVSLPAAVGAELDLKVAMGEAMGPKADRIDKARITRLEDVDGLPVYSTEIVIVTPMGEREVHLIHSPDEVSGEYSGTLYSRAQRNSTNLTAAESDKDSLFSVVYAKKKDGEEYRMKYELRAAQVNEGLVADAFTSEGQLDLNVGVDFSLPTSDANYGAHLKADGTPYGANEAISGMTYILFDMNPATNEGTVAYWQNPGASWNEAARGMVATLEKSNDGFKGCAISGAALGTSQNPFEDSLSIRKSIKKEATLKPEGYFHPFFHTQTDSNCDAAADGSDASGTYKTKDCLHADPSNAANTEQYRKWYLPKVSTTTLAAEFIEKSVGRIISRQCYNLQDGVYNIDTAEVNEDAGYQLIKSNDAGSADLIIAPPSVKEDL